MLPHLKEKSQKQRALKKDFKVITCCRKDLQTGALFACDPRSRCSGLSNSGLSTTGCAGLVLTHRQKTPNHCFKALQAKEPLVCEDLDGFGDSPTLH